MRLLYEVGQRETIYAFAIVMPRILLMLHYPDAFLLYNILGILAQNDNLRFTVRLPIS